MKAMKIDTHILSRRSHLNIGYVLSGKQIDTKIAEKLFKSQCDLESQFMAKMPIIVMSAPIPEQAIHVVDNTYLLSPEHLVEMGDVTHFLVNAPFCDMLDIPFLDIFDMLAYDTEKLLELSEKTFMLGIADEA